MSRLAKDQQVIIGFCLVLKHLDIIKDEFWHHHTGGPLRLMRTVQESFAMQLYGVFKRNATK